MQDEIPLFKTLRRACLPPRDDRGESLQRLLDFNTLVSLRDLLDQPRSMHLEWHENVALIDSERNTIVEYYRDLQPGDLQGEWEEHFAWRRLRSTFCMAAALSGKDATQIVSHSKSALRTFGINVESDGERADSRAPLDIISAVLASAGADSDAGFLFDTATYLAGRERAAAGTIRLPVCVLGAQRSPVPAWLTVDALHNGFGRIFLDPKKHFYRQFSADYTQSLNAVATATRALMQNVAGTAGFDYRLSIDLPGDYVVCGTSMSGAIAAAVLVLSQMDRNRPNSLVVLAECKEDGVLSSVDGVGEKIIGVRTFLESRYRGRAVLLLPPGNVLRATAEFYLSKDIAARNHLPWNDSRDEATRISWRLECLSDLTALQAFLRDAKSESKPRISIEPVPRPRQPQSKTAEFLRKFNPAGSGSFEPGRRIVPQTRLPVEPELQFQRKEFIEWQGIILESKRPPKLLIHGQSGTGKTHLLLMLAHLVIEPLVLSTDHSAGLYVDLLGHSGQPVSQEECLRKLLVSLLGSTFYDLPERLEDLHDLYTQHLEGQTLTVYLDNVVNFDQVELVIPPSHCGCVISARENFAIDRFAVINVREMDDAEAGDFALRCFQESVKSDEFQRDDLLALTDDRMLELAKRIASTCKGHALSIAFMVGGFIAEFRERPDWDTLLAELETKTRSNVGDLFAAMYSELKEYKDAARRLSVFPRDFDEHAANCVLKRSSGNTLVRLSRCNVLTPTKARRDGKDDLRYLMHDAFRAFLREKLSDGRELDDCFELLTKYFSDLSQLSIPAEHRLVDDGKEFIFASNSTTLYKIRDWLCGQKLSYLKRKDALKFAEVWHSTFAQRTEDAEENSRFVMAAIDWASRTKGFSQLHFELLLSHAEILKRSGNRKGGEPVLESAIEVAKHGLKPKDVSQAMFDLIFLVVDWDADKATRFAYDRTILEAKQQIPDRIALAMGLLGMVADEGHHRPLDGLTYYRTALQFGEKYARTGKSVFTSSNRVASIARSIDYHVISRRYFHRAFLSDFCQTDKDWRVQSLVDWLNACRLSGVSQIDTAIDRHVESVVKPALEEVNNSEALEILTNATRLHFSSGNATSGWEYLRLARAASKDDASLSSQLRQMARQMLRSLSDFSTFERLLTELEAWHKADAFVEIQQDLAAEAAELKEDSTSDDVASPELADLYDEAGLRYEQESQFPQAVDYYWKSLRTAQKANDSRMIRIAWQRLIRANLQRSDHEAACDSARTILARLQADDSLSEEERDQFITTGRAFVGALLRRAQRGNEAWQEFDAAHAAAIAAESDDLLGVVIGCIGDLDGIADPDVREKEFRTAVEFLRQRCHFDACLKLYAIQLRHATRTCSPEIVERFTKEFVTVAAETASRDESVGSIAIAPYAILCLTDENIALRTLSELQSAVGEDADRSLEFPLRLARVMILQHYGHTREAIECVGGFSEISSAMTDEQQCEAHTQIAHLLRQNCEFRKSKKILEQIREFADKKRMDAFIIIAEANLAILAISQCEYAEAHELAVQCRRKCTDNRIKAYLLAIESELFQESGDVEQATQLASDSLRMAENVGDDDCLINALLRLVSCRRANIDHNSGSPAGECRAIDSELSRMVELAKHHSDVHVVLDVLEAQVECEIAKGRVEEAELRFRKFVDACRRTDSVLVACRARLLGGKMAVARGALEQAYDIFSSAQELCAGVHAVHLEHLTVQALLQLSERYQIEPVHLESLRTRREELRYDFDSVDDALLQQVEGQLHATDAPSGLVASAVGLARAFLRWCVGSVRRGLKARASIPNAVKTRGVSIGEVFEEMAKHFDPVKAGKISATYQFNISGDGGGIWAFVVDDGKCSFVVGGVPYPSVKIELPAEAWLAIREGTLNSQKAFMEGTLKVHGDMNLAMKLQQLFPMA